MVWFSEETVSLEMLYDHFLARLTNVPLEESEEGGSTTAPSAAPIPSSFPLSSTGVGAASSPSAGVALAMDEVLSGALQVQRDCANLLLPYFVPDALVSKTLEHAMQGEHVMDMTRMRALNSLFAMLNQAVRNVFTYNHFHPDFPMQVHPHFYII